MLSPDPPCKKRFSFDEFPAKIRDRVRAFPEIIQPSDFLFHGDSRITPEYFADTPCIGVIGTRRPTAYGLRFLNQWLDVQAAEGFTGCLLSGGALGIDGALHQGALDRGLKTQAVLVGPLATPSPRQHAPIFSRIVGCSEGGLWVPQLLEPDERRKPQSSWWLTRNQWLSACCDALIVVEAGLYSGTWYTVKIAQKFGIPVFALPGSFDSPVSVGTNSMIARGYAHSIVSLTDLQKTLVVELGVNPYNRYQGQGEQGTTYAKSRATADQTTPQMSDFEAKMLKNIRLWIRQPRGIGLKDLVLRALEAGYRVSQLEDALDKMSRQGELARLGDRFEGRR